MKVSIMSMQRIANYGSFLQAYALKKTIEMLGHQVDFADYRVQTCLIQPQKVEQGKDTYIKDKAFRLMNAIKCFAYKIPFDQHKQFYQNYSGKYLQIVGVSDERRERPDTDVLVIGSDEVFNCVQSNPDVGCSMELFGKDSRAKKIISYAASFGNTTIEKIEKYSKKEELSKLLKKIDAISVRDDNSYNIVSKLTKVKPQKNLDPVLIYEYMEKKDIIPNLDLKEKYLILYAYSVRITKNEAKKIKIFAKKNKLKIYSIGGVQKCADRFIDCSPFEVLSYFNNAEYIITDTFHGSIFSIINHKKFVTLVRKSSGNSYGNEEKLTDLLKTLDLNKRMIYDVDDLENIIYESIDYKSVEKILKIEREKTKKYIKENI